MKLLLTEKNIRTGFNKDVCFIDLKQEEIDVLKVYLEVIKTLDQLELSVKKVDNDDITVINLNRFLKNKKNLKCIYNVEDLLHAYIESYNGENITHLQKTVLLEICTLKKFPELVKTCKDEYGRTSIKKLVDKVLNGKIHI